MKFHKAWLWVALGGVIALVFVSVLIRDPGVRALLSVVAVLPLLHVTLRVALDSERDVAREKRKYMKLRTVTDEFILNVRNLNRLTIVAKGKDAPEDVDRMIDEVVARMHSLVDRMREAAGEESPFPPTMEER
ncbi:MAG: hypothetical protein GWN99_20095 [Gemmatimonadetes bacterium]|uniref:Uncharacterized protein n=1 Tax=Candidatus Kutchimonas denitrificans TaxID=3056748 RepID=A0AAE4ZC94_9BACT|nr:hypothetical protein [Gemmatimonadota bacterium]NIR76506.1 hypothetical protein [Candidatus Kutchimonas denitrificans]NIS03324.1 hypothetical protein [Gemmatimonadota bacterium]NIT69185.1 hypothetical protein [Gemmatimonadota bacterium]NIU54577.1 hypothetical protein [Gemmatimonadota bacterium]